MNLQPSSTRDSGRLDRAAVMGAFAAQAALAGFYLSAGLGVVPDDLFFVATESAALPLVLVPSLVLAVWRYRGAVGDPERRFWRLVSLGLGSYLVLRVTYIGLEGFWSSTGAAVYSEPFYLAFYLSMILALRARPDQVPSLKDDPRLRLVDTGGAVVFVLGVLAYFVVIPLLFTPFDYEAGGPTQIQYTLLDLVIMLGFLQAAFRTTSPAWRRSYGAFAIAFTLFAITDVTDGILYLAGGETSIPWWLDHLYYLPHLSMSLAAYWGRMPGDEQPGTPAAYSASAWSILVAFALILPGLHLILEAAGIMDPAPVRYRNVLVLAHLLSLMGLAWLYQRMLVTRLGEAERTSRSAQAERLLLAAAIEQAVEGVAVAGDDFRITYANRAFVDRDGSYGEELIGQSVLELVRPGDGADIRSLVVANGRWSGRVKHTDSEGEIHEEDVSVAPVRDGNGETSHYIIVRRDVTAESELERQLQQSQKMESLGTLAGGIAHDFNNILVAILGNVELAAKALEPDHAALANLAAADKAAERASSLVDQILTFSRKSEVGWETLDVAPILEEVRDLIRASAPATVQLSLQTAPGLPRLRGVATQLHQVFLNLATNAVQSIAETGSVRIEAGLGENADGEGGLEVLVSDTGAGIPTAIQHRIFDPFFTTKRVGKGTGLGLAVVHGVIAAHGGTIAVESTPGAGTRFRVWLPATREAVGVIPPTEPADLDIRGTGRVAVVEDEVAVRELVCLSLEGLGYSAEGFRGPDEALPELLRTPPDLLVTDQTMPGMTGIDMVSRLREEGADYPVILMTGFAPSVDAATRDSLGIDEIVSKPFRTQHLAAAVARLLKGNPVAQTPS